MTEKLNKAPILLIVFFALVLQIIANLIAPYILPFLQPP